MPDYTPAIKAALIPLVGNDVQMARKIEVQFNPETLRVSHQSVAPGAARSVDQKGTPTLTSSPGSMSLSVQLWFDVTEVHASGANVQMLTQPLVDLLMPVEATDPTAGTPPIAARRIRFLWGSFIFDGTVASLDESFEFFSTDGNPLRASLTLAMTGSHTAGNRDGSRNGGGIGISAGIGIGAGIGAGIGISASAGLSAGAGIGIGVSVGAGVGTTPLIQAQAGASVQGMVGANADWQVVAAANGIENPRLLDPGQLVNVNVRASTSVGF